MYQIYILLIRGGGAALNLFFAFLIATFYEGSISSKFFYLFSLASVISTIIKFGLENWILSTLPSLFEKNKNIDHLNNKLISNALLLGLSSCVLMFFALGELILEVFAIFMAVMFSSVSVFCAFIQAQNKVLFSIFIRNIAPAGLFFVLYFSFFPASFNGLVLCFISPYFLLLVYFSIINRKILNIFYFQKLKAKKLIKRQLGFAGYSIADSVYVNFPVIVAYLIGLGEYTVIYALAARFARVMRLIASTVTVYVIQQKVVEYVSQGGERLIKGFFIQAKNLIIFNFILSFFFLASVLLVNKFGWFKIKLDLIALIILSLLLLSETIYSSTQCLINYFIVIKKLSRISVVFFGVIAMALFSVLLSGGPLSPAFSLVFVSFILYFYCINSLNKERKRYER